MEYIVSIDLGLIDYEVAWRLQDQYAAEIAAGTRPPTLLLLEHPHVYTFGRKGNADNLLWNETQLKGKGISTYWVDRGGDVTYHGPGQRVGYVMLDLQARGGDLRRFVHDLEEWIIRTLARFNVTGERRQGRVGIWVATGKREDKIAAIGVRVRRGVSYHGISLNLEPDLSHFAGIVPCGISEGNYGVTSLAKLGIMIPMPELDMALKGAFAEVFGEIS